MDAAHAWLTHQNALSITLDRQVPSLQGQARLRNVRDVRGLPSPKVNSRPHVDRELAYQISRVLASPIHAEFCTKNYVRAPLSVSFAQSRAFLLNQM